MDWKERLKTDERELKSIVDMLGETRGEGLRARAQREFAAHALSAKLSDMRGFVEDCLSGRNEHERAVLAYQLRVEYPLYSHLESLSGLSREYVEWSCA
jgi:hypothetical protein